MKYFLMHLALMGLALSLQAQNDLQRIHEAVHKISSSDLLEVVEELAGDQYRGRLTGSPEYLAAAAYLARQFEELGLQPAVNGQEWFQWFDWPYTEVKAGCSLELLIPVGKHDSVRKQYHYFDEFMPGSTSASGSLIAEVVFVGWGISAPELGFDEYQGVDVKGKIVLMRPEAPVSPAAGAEVFTPWLPYSLHQYKMQNAVNHGAAGVLYHYGPLANSNNSYHPELISTLVGQVVVNDLFSGSGRDYNEVVARIQDQLKPESFPLKKTVQITNTTVFHPDGRGNNVLGLLPGSDPVLSSEVILIGAHLDHVGTCYEVCPGAQDNASGIAALLGVAKALAESKYPLKRSVLFIGFGAEEQGLIGSKTYVANPVFPLEKTKCLINLDCVGVGQNFHAGGADNYPDIFSAFMQANARYFQANLSGYYAANVGRPRTDAAVFMSAGVKALSFSSSGGTSYYHNPLDRVETIWPESLETIAGLVTYAVAELANREEVITKGPDNGTLIIAGGALRDTAVFARFVELAGGVDARILYVPTAQDDSSLDTQEELDRLTTSFARYGVAKVTVLHTRNREDADQMAMVELIDQADAIWFAGGRQWRIADSFLHTKAHSAMNRLLGRGGVIGGSSAGATIQGSYLFRGDTRNNTILCGDHEEGLGFLSNVAIDQHLLARNRQFDLFEALEKYPGILGIGLDENTAIEVKGSVFTVLGQSYVAVYDGQFYSKDRGGYVNMTRGGWPFYFLRPGQRYDLENRKVLE